MTLENLLRTGQLKAHAADEREILRLLDSARLALKDAAVAELMRLYRAAGGQSWDPAQAVREVFECLDELEARLSERTYLVGEQITETDWRVFVTAIRFDVAYYGLFRCNLKRLVDYPNLSRYLKRLYDVPGIAATVDFDHIKKTYYSISWLNPSGIVPLGPQQVFAEDL